MLGNSKKISLMLLICIPVVAGVFFLVFNLYSSFQEQGKIAETERTITVIDELIAQVTIKTVDFTEDVVELARGYTAPQYQLGDFTGLKQGFLDNDINFVEVNLQEMKVRVNKQNEKQKEFEIIKRGDDEGWGGTATGLYSVKSGFEASYSASSGTYMPWALKFYGKYYLHGEPYYPGGIKLISDFSGGCIRMYDEDAKEVYESTDIDMPVLVIDKTNDYYEYPKQVQGLFPNITSTKYLVADLDSGFVFAEKESNQQHPVASITKLMTSLVVAENIDLTKSIVVRDWMLKGYGSSDYLEENPRLRVVELFYLLLIESSNNAAEVISYFLGRDNTIDLMNKKTKSILMSKTVFTDPSGYDPGNISTAQDLFYLARYIKNNRFPIFEITRSGKVSSFGGVKFDIDGLWNKNVFSEDETFVGGKTGFIKESKYNGLFVFQFKTKDNEERNVAIILLGSKHQANLKSDAQKAYIWLQRNYF